VNVLITAASRRVALVQAFEAALQASGRGRVIVTDVDATSPAVHVAHRAYRVPLATDPHYVDALLEICVAEQIALVVPTVDDELEAMAAARPRFAAVGAALGCSPADTAALCNDKYATCTHLTAHGVEAAQSWLPDTMPDGLPEVLFIKPRRGRGSVGAHLIRNRREREFFLDYVADPVVQEFLQAPEYTIDMLCGWDGSPLAVVPRERTVIRSGVSDRGRTVRDSRLEALALEVAATMTFHGPVNIQCRMRGDTPVVFEINPRFSGGISLTIAAGADFAGMLVRMAAGAPVPPRLGAYRDDFWMTKHDTAIFLPAKRVQLLPFKAVRERVRRVAS
jgi:carbamoyl-phosphate synthase large subunit